MARPAAQSDREWFVPVAAIVTIETLLWSAAYVAEEHVLFSVSASGVVSRDVARSDRSRFTARGWMALPCARPGPPGPSAGFLTTLRAFPP